MIAHCLAQLTPKSSHLPSRTATAGSVSTRRVVLGLYFAAASADSADYAASAKYFAAASAAATEATHNFIPDNEN